MLCIIAGHMGSSLINGIVFTFHVPIFFILCGLFFKIEKGNLWNNVKKLFKAYVFTLLFVLILDVIKQSLRMILSSAFSLDTLTNLCFEYVKSGLFCFDTETEIFGISARSVGAIWFYVALIWAFLFSFIILKESERISKNKAVSIGVSSLLAVILWLAAYLTTDILQIPLLVQAGAGTVIFIISGYHLKSLYLNKQPIWIGICSLILWAIAIYFSITGRHMSAARVLYPNPILNFLGAISATWLIISFFKRFTCHIPGKGLELFGKYSMVALSFHYIEKNLIDWEKLTGRFGGGLLINILAFLVKVSWCCLGIFLARKIAPLKWVYSIKE